MSPIDVTLLGIVTLASDLQPSNIESTIDVILPPIVTLVSDAQL